MLSVTAYAKINWMLDIVGRREDGYHLMDMLMQSVSLGDKMTFSLSDKLECSGENLTGTRSDASSAIAAPPLLFDESNLILKAAKLLKDRYHVQQGATIHIEKYVPFGAGMGGGSADAAATLLGLNRLWELGLTLDELCDLALPLGADIPFMLHGGFAHVQGIGEKIRDLHAIEGIPMLLYQNCGGVSTGTIFRQYDTAKGEASHPDSETCIRLIQEKQFVLLRKASFNALQPVVARFVPELEKGIETLYTLGASFAQMTGSGSVVFGVFPSTEQADMAADTLRRQHPDHGIWPVKTLSKPWNFIEK